MENLTDKRHFLFSMTDDTGNEFRFEETISGCNHRFQEELEYLLDQFKAFLKAAGFCEVSTDRLQYLEDEEFEYVLKSYGYWTSEHERLKRLREEDAND